MKKKTIETPKFANEAEEEDWWASRQGWEFVKQNATGAVKKGTAPKTSRLVGELNRAASVQIALCLPERTGTSPHALRKTAAWDPLL